MHLLFGNSFRSTGYARQCGMQALAVGKKLPMLLLGGLQLAFCCCLLGSGRHTLDGQSLRQGLVACGVLKSTATTRDLKPTLAVNVSTLEMMHMDAQSRCSSDSAAITHHGRDVQSKHASPRACSWHLTTL